jgi:hypothetical protein
VTGSESIDLVLLVGVDRRLGRGDALPGVGTDDERPAQSAPVAATRPADRAAVTETRTPGRQLDSVRTGRETALSGLAVSSYERRTIATLLVAS